jgi:hypothetical protein
MDERIRTHPRMVALLWEQHEEKTALSARHAQRYVGLVLALKKELREIEAIEMGG